MKKILLSLFVLFPLICHGALRIGGIYYKLSGNIAIVTSPIQQNGRYEGNLVIPANVIHNGKTYRVTRIEEKAFANSTALKTVKLESNVTTIGENAFWKCTDIEEVTWNNKQITKIDDGAFNECTNLKKVGDVSGVTSLGNSAFSKCHNLKSLNFSSKLTSIGTYAFYNCTNLENIGDLRSVTEIKHSTFSGCNMLRNGDEGIDIRSVVSICKSCFYGLKMEKVIVSSKLKDIPNNAFDGCINLKSIVTEKNEVPQFTQIGDGAFKNCSSLQQLPDFSLLTKIPNYAFYGCSSISSVSIPNNIKEIGGYAFADCYSRIDDGTQYIEHGIRSVIGGEGLSYIGSNVFQGDKLLKIVRLGKCPDGWNGKISYIGENIGYIYAYAFSCCRDLDSIRLEMSNYNAPYVGNDAFRTCANLRRVRFREGLKTICESAFCDCILLNNVELPSTLTTIGKAAFQGCSSFRDGGVFELDNQGKKKNSTTPFTEEKPSYLKLLGNNCFEGTAIRDIHGSYKQVSTSRRLNVAVDDSLGGFYLPYGIEELGEKCFSNCKNLVSVELPASVKTINSNAFAYCEKLSSI